MRKKESKILIGTPVNTIKLYCWDEYAEEVEKTGYDVLVVDTSKDGDMEQYIKSHNFMYDHVYEEKAMDRVVSARNMIVEFAKNNGYTHIMWVDADIILKKGLVERLLSYDKPIVSAVYMTIGKDENPRIVHNIEYDKGYKPMPVDYIETGLREASQIGFGCVLTKVTPVFDKAEFRCERYSNGFIRYGEDYCVCNDLNIKYEIPILVDTDIQVSHLVNDVWDLENT